MENFIEILKISIPGLLVMLTAWMVLKNQLKKEIELKQRELIKESNKTLLPLKLQAYERLALFLERISPDNMITHTRKTGMTAKELQIALIRNIRAEYEHNLSQQIYVGTDVWTAVHIAKDEVIKLINLCGAAQQTAASGLNFSRAILEFMLKDDHVMPTQRAMNILKTEIKKTLG